MVCEEDDRESSKTHVRGTANRHPSTRVFGSPVVLDDGRSRKQAARFQDLLNNHRTHSSREGRTPVTPVSRPIANLRSFRWQPQCRSLYQTPMAAWLSRRLGLTSASSQPLKTPGMKSSGICDLGYRAFRGSDRFTATRVRTESESQFACAARLPIKSALP
jgi:hypothetical protein